jgi:hypothetical protein
MDGVSARSQFASNLLKQILIQGVVIKLVDYHPAHQDPDKSLFAALFVMGIHLPFCGQCQVMGLFFGSKFRFV